MNWSHSRRVMLAALVFAAACTSPTDSTPTDVQLVGNWHYTAAQTSGPRVTYDGMLAITQQAGRTFSGGLDVQATSPQGTVMRVNGVVSGRVVSTSSVDFDLQLTDDVRRHVGSVVRDSIKGTWATADLSTIGAFTAVRIR